MKILLISFLSLFLASCMHLGMIGTHGENQSRDHQTTAENELEKQVTKGDVMATAIFPPLQVGKEAVFSLKLVNASTNRLLSGARVSFHVAYLHSAEKSEMQGMHMMHEQMDSTRAHAAQEHDINLDLEVTENRTPGVYTISFTPSQPGEHRLMFHISEIGGHKLEQEIIVEAQRVVAAAQSQHSMNMMHGSSGASDYLIVGAAIMGALMLVVWITGGRML